MTSSWFYIAVILNKGTLSKLVQAAADNGNKRADYLMKNGFDHFHHKNLVKLVIYFEEFNQEDIFETPKYTVSYFHILHACLMLNVFAYKDTFMCGMVF